MPYLLTANPGSPTSWVKMETDSVLSGASEPLGSMPNGHTPTPRQRNRPLPAVTATSAAAKYSNYINSAATGGNNSSTTQLLGNGTLPPNFTLSQRTANGVVPTPPMLLSPTSVLSNYSLGGTLSRNLGNGHPMNLNLANRTNSVLSNNPSPSGNPLTSLLHNNSNSSNQSNGANSGNSSSPFQQSQLPHTSLKSLSSMPTNQAPHQAPPPGAGMSQCDTAIRFGTLGGHQQERIEVQILPQQDPDWGDNTTAVTGLSDLAFPPGPLSRWGEDHQQQLPGTKSSPNNGLFSGGNGDFLLDEDGWAFAVQRYMGAWTVGFLSAVAFVSPLLMLIIPQLSIVHLRESQLRCDVECDGLLLSFSFKLLILLVGSWAVFFRSPRATMPRIYLYRSCVCVLLFILVFSFWLFFGVRLAGEQRRRMQYVEVVQYATSMVDAMLFVHYLAVLLIELRHSTPEYYIKVVRSPDGESRSYAVGPLSIQRAAVWVLEKYYTDFPIYNPYLERVGSGNYAPVWLASGRSQGTTPRLAANNGYNRGYKYQDADPFVSSEKDRLTSPLTRHGYSSKRESHLSASASDKYYEEYEYERRVRKRRARLLAATEEAFAHIKRLHDEKSKTPSSPLDSYETAQSIFPGIARPLQKYLRITRQQPRHTMESILSHLANCLKYDMAPKAFLEKFFVDSPVLQSDREHRPVQTWALICDMLLSRSLKPGTIFQLRQGDVSLLCEVQQLPHFNITEEIIDSASNKFLLRNNSETPV